MVREKFKRVWSKKGQPSFSKTFRLTKPMLDTLEKLANIEGETLNTFVVLALDDYLQIQSEKNPAVKPPKSAS